MELKKKWVLLIAGILIVVIAGCTTAPKINLSKANETGSTENTPGKNLDQNQVEQTKKDVTTDFCKSYKVKSAELELKSIQRRIEKEQRDMGTIEQRLAAAKAAKDELEITKKTKERDDAQDALDLAKKAEAEATAKLQETLNKCLDLNKGKSSVCKEFMKEVEEKIASAQNEFTKAKDDLTGVEAQLDKAKKSNNVNITKAVIKSIEDQVNDQNLEVLKQTNLVTKFQKYKSEIEGICA